MIKCIIQSYLHFLVRKSKLGVSTWSLGDKEKIEIGKHEKSGGDGATWLEIEIPGATWLEIEIPGATWLEIEIPN